MPAGRQWPALVLLAGLRAAEAFSTPSLARLPRATSARSLAARTPLRAPLQADGAAGDGKVLEFLEFVIGSTFKSPLYVGSADLHMAIPLPPPDTYPQWLPAFLKLPQAAYDYAERGVEEGWIKRADADQVFEIKYGVLRGEINVLPDSECEACELAKRKELEKSAASELVNIGEAERSRRSRTGYVIMASSIFAAYLAVDLDGGPWVRFPVGFLAVLGYAFVESGKNGL